MRENSIFLNVFPNIKVREEAIEKAKNEPKSTDLADYYFTPLEIDDALGTVMVDQERNCALLAPWQWKIFKRNQEATDKKLPQFEERQDGRFLVIF